SRFAATSQSGPLGRFTYSWVEMSIGYRSDHGLANPRKKEGNRWVLIKNPTPKEAAAYEPSRNWEQAQDAIRRGVPFVLNDRGPLLGADTVKYGALSVFLAFIAVLLFMLVYYRFAGFVACVALMANLLLTIAFMVVIQATFTLPGLAGLVLMLGMAVDANVLIYERLREERDRGASLALAIRNGYDRAFP